MNLRQLEVFLSIVEQGSFSAAARQSFLTQSTVSQHMAVLEEELGVQLLERSRNGIRLTEAGKILRKHARQIQTDLKAAQDAILRHRGSEEATLRVAASTIPGGHLVPSVLVWLCERFPKLDVVMLQGDSRATAERIANREAEVGVVGSRFQERGLTYEPVGRDEIRLVLPGGHPWANRGQVSLSELPEIPLIVREQGSGTAKTVADALDAAGVDRTKLRIRAQMGSNETIRAAVLAGLGASFLSEVAVHRDVERGDLAAVQVAGLQIARPFYLVQRSGRELSPPAESFRARMVERYG